MEERAPPMAYNPGAERTKRTRRPSYVPPENIRPPPPQPQEQPRPTIHQAVSSAFLNTNAQQIGNQELVDTITQQVIQSLRASGFGASPAAPPVQDPTPVPPKDLPPRNVYTPPSPEKFELPKIDPTGPKVDARSPTTDTSMEEAAFGRRSSMRPASPSTSARKTESSRPPPPERAPTDDRTTLEKIWQPLFGADGKPTARLGQFLRGVANHIVRSSSLSPWISC